MNSAMPIDSGQRDQQRDDRHQQGAEHQRRQVAQEALAAGQVLAVGRQGRQRLADEEQRHAGQHDQDDDAGAGGQPGEDAVAEPARGLGRGPAGLRAATPRA
jgi:hypothetical protein